MPLLDLSLNNHAVAGTNYGFSAMRIADLGASEYTLGLIIVDVSGSVAGFRRPIEEAVKQVVRSCRHHPRADNMMLRLVTFDDRVDEVHGYKPLTDCNPQDYTGCINTGGSTALYDATYNGIESAARYGAELNKHNYGVNSALFVITDGMDNCSKSTMSMVKKSLHKAVTSESLESIISILIGVNTGANGLNEYLDRFKKTAGFSQYVAIAQATEKQLAKLGGFVSQTLSSQSQALGTGGPSQTLVF